MACGKYGKISVMCTILTETSHHFKSNFAQLICNRHVSLFQERCYSNTQINHLRSINRNMIIHFANQSQTRQLLKILTRPLYVASFLVIFFFFFFLKIPVGCIFPGNFHSFFVAFSFSIPVHWIFPSHLHFHSVALLFIFPEFWK